MEYSKDIILGIKYPETRKKGQAEPCNKKMFNFLKKHGQTERAYTAVI